VCRKTAFFDDNIELTQFTILKNDEQ